VDNEEDPLLGMVEALVHTQGSSLALNFILMEVVRHLAQETGDPEKFLSTLYDRVYARLDNAPTDRPEKQAELDMRDTVDRFFSNARRWTTG
jgi:hypothetical protein